MSIAGSQQVETVADLVEHLGGISPDRIRMQPLPGTATEEDLYTAWKKSGKRLCELIDGVVVEKVMGMLESILAGILLQYINNYLAEKDLGVASGADGPIRILPGEVRLPDVAVFTWSTIGGRELPNDKVFNVIPDLTVEIISEGNTRKEIEHKLRDYFLAGVKQVWVVYPKSQSAKIFTAPDTHKRVTSRQALTGGDLLPGFELPMGKLFERVAKPAKGKE